jgi:hypothetical protein
MRRDIIQYIIIPQILQKMLRYMITIIVCIKGGREIHLYLMIPLIHLISTDLSILYCRIPAAEYNVL